MILSVINCLIISTASYFREGCEISFQSSTSKFLSQCTDCGNANVAMASGNSGDQQSIFTVHELGNERIALRANNGNYIGSCVDCFGGTYRHVLVTNFEELDNWKTSIKPEIQSNGFYKLKFEGTPLGNLYISPCNNCVDGVTGSPIILSKTAPQFYTAKWGIHVLSCPALPSDSLKDNCVVSFKNVNNERYLSDCQNCNIHNEQKAITVNRQVISTESQFRLNKLEDGTFSIQNSDRRHVSICNPCDPLPNEALTVSVSRLDEELISKFLFTDIGNGNYSIQINDKYLSRCQECVEVPDLVDGSQITSLDSNAQWMLLVHSCPSFSHTLTDCVGGCIKNHCL